MIYQLYVDCFKGETFIIKPKCDSFLDVFLGQIYFGCHIFAEGKGVDPSRIHHTWYSFQDCLNQPGSLPSKLIVQAILLSLDDRGTIVPSADLNGSLLATKLFYYVNKVRVKYVFKNKQTFFQHLPALLSDVRIVPTVFADIKMSLRCDSQNFCSAYTLSHILAPVREIESLAGRIQTLHQHRIKIFLSKDTGLRSQVSDLKGQCTRPTIRYPQKFISL